MTTTKAAESAENMRLSVTPRRQYHRPCQIVLIRHGESEANVDQGQYTTVGDPNVELTDLGKQQSRLVGEKLAISIGKKSVFVYVSPYMRTRQTAHIIRYIIHMFSAVLYCCTLGTPFSLY